jgi:hypothetical protein
LESNKTILDCNKAPLESNQAMMETIKAQGEKIKALEALLPTIVNCDQLDHIYLLTQRGYGYNPILVDHI